MRKKQLTLVLIRLAWLVLIPIFMASPAAAENSLPESLDINTPTVPEDYPESVDNSLNPAFPPIGDQGYLASCVAWATTYYQFTYETNLARGIRSDSDETIFSPRWTYNLINNGGGHNLTSLSDAYTLLTRNGAVTLAEFPYYDNDSLPEYYLAWCLDPAAWQRAIHWRAANWGMINHSDDSDVEQFINELKSRLAEGHILVFVTYVNSWIPDMISDGPAAGELIATHMINSESDLHSMTLTGYDDHIWCDINKNGEAEEGEYGAFKVANSRGAADWNNGFRWVSYDALREVSAIPATENWSPGERDTRGIFLRAAYTLTVSPSYTPEVIVEVTLSHSLRNQLAVSLGVGEAESTQPSSNIWVSGALCYNHDGQGQGGPYAFDGSNSSCEGTFFFDYTDITGPATEGQRYFIGISDNTADGAEASVSSMRVYQVQGDSYNLIAESERGLTVDGDTQYIWADYIPLIAAAEDQCNLTINIVGGGSVISDTDEELHNLNSTVILTATPDEGWTFWKWGGDLRGNTNPVSAVMDEDKTITATFVRNVPAPEVNTPVFIPPPPPVQVTVTLTGFSSNSSLTVDAAGTASASTRLETADNRAILMIEPGTFLKDKSGTGLKAISAETPVSSPSPPPSSVLVTSYKLGPEGASFSSPLSLAIKYDPEKLQAGSSENNLYLAYWNGEDWTTLACRIDKMKKTVSALINHFSHYALLERIPPPPAEFSVSDLKVSTGVAEPGESVSIQVTASNKGGSPGTYMISLKINGQKEDKWYAVLQPGQSRDIVFETRRYNPGDYLVEVNELAGGFRVASQPEETPEASATGPALIITASPVTTAPTATPAAISPENVPTRKMMVPLIWIIAALAAVITISILAIMKIKKNSTHKLNRGQNGLQ
jgi:hypothetical protein